MLPKEQNITWLDRKWTVSRSSYAGNGRVALTLTDEDGWEPGPVVTVNLPDECVPKGQVAIRDYSETAGILAALILGGVVGRPVRYVRSGFITIPICPLELSQ